jgi:hypothetical protein
LRYRHVVRINCATVCEAEIVSRLAEDNQDSVAAGPAGRFHHELPIIICYFVVISDLMRIFDLPIQGGNVDADVLREFLGQELVVGHRIVSPLVVGKKVIGIAFVQAHNAIRPKSMCEPKHQPRLPASARKRIKSSRRNPE